MSRRKRIAILVATLLGIGVLGVVVFSRTTPKWRELQGVALDEHRRGHSMVLLPNKSVLIVGGSTLVQEDKIISRGVMVKDCEIYDPNTNTCSMTGSRCHPDEPAAYVTLRDGKVLAIGKGPTWAHCEIYDPSPGAWSDVAPVSMPRFQFEAALLTNGEVLIAGGSFGVKMSADCELFDPTPGTWRKAAPMLLPRSMHRIIPLRDGKALVMGGSLEPRDCEVFDPKMNLWTKTAPMIKDRGTSFIAVGLQDGRVLVAGGSVLLRGSRGIESDPDMTSEIYDPATNRWTAAAKLPIAIDLNYNSSHLLDNGNVVVIGLNYGKDCLLYESRWNIWRSIPAPHVPRYDHASVKLADGRILVSGGYKGGNGIESILQSFEVLE